MAISHVIVVGCVCIELLALCLALPIYQARAQCCTRDRCRCRDSFTAPKELQEESQANKRYILMLSVFGFTHNHPIPPNYSATQP